MDSQSDTKSPSQNPRLSCLFGATDQKFLMYIWANWKRWYLGNALQGIGDLSDLILDCSHLIIQLPRIHAFAGLNLFGIRFGQWHKVASEVLLSLLQSRTSASLSYSRVPKPLSPSRPLTFPPPHSLCLSPAVLSRYKRYLVSRLSVTADILKILSVTRMTRMVLLSRCCRPFWRG